MKYFDDLLIHQIKSIFYSNYEAEFILSDLEEMIEEIEDRLRNIKNIRTAKEVRRYLDDIEGLISDYIDGYEFHMKSVATSVAERESNWFGALILSSYAIGVVIPDSLSKNVSLMPYSTTNTISSFASGMKQRLNNTVKNNLNTGLFWGYGGEQLVENIEKPLESVKRAFSTETQEMVQSFVKTTQRQIQKENRKIFTGYKWCSILDSKVCDVCAELNGTVYKDISTVPFIPIHYKCRCSTISFIQEDAEPDWDSFSEWIEELDEEDQLEILGRTRFDLWKSGELEVKDFVNDGRKILLSDLYDE